ncbi:MAG: hypothetical protein ACJ8F3_00465 [Xanthobacteraceae bacterium]
MSSGHYRAQAQRCLILSRATIDLSARLWFTDLASYYVAKARAADPHESEHGIGDDRSYASVPSGKGFDAVTTAG